MDKWFYPTLHQVCDRSSMQGLKLFCTDKIGPGGKISYGSVNRNIFVSILSCLEHSWASLEPVQLILMYFKRAWWVYSYIKSFSTVSFETMHGIIWYRCDGNTSCTGKCIFSLCIFSFLSKRINSHFFWYLQSTVYQFLILFVEFSSGNGPLTR